MGIFGTKDDQPVSTDNAAAAPVAPLPAEPMSTPPPLAPPPSDPAPFAQPPAPAPLPATPPAPAASDYIMTPAPEPALTPAYPVEATAPAINSPSVPVASVPVAPVAAEPTAFDPLAEPSSVLPATDTQGSSDLSALKQQALQQLSPLVNHLDQSPEERFQTTMMMLQATDDQSLIQEAYNAAQEITDEKARAQALLDVINEINYFSQHKS